ncbi:hypothetical protein HYPBUDRAFT_170275 [Hyphopichia burtonii NRRL Y-1933]|uniref:Uncharacterized protein n=1 Tax=Hyphopichia burtonii NRRL Y-1933 TaxID=984485 RepID=A0A1E4RQ19_9ASCO|nr:hypothetical protein HYPBUDRAFT_170275 [Hyphopichia burtonii NRRL Y-1933]ODV69370.1 hypothetical protein HYPBUDRAFT_170275 [Hyphopichia burtonii NRRL Y-1933]
MSNCALYDNAQQMNSFRVVCMKTSHCGTPQSHFVLTIILLVQTHLRGIGSPGSGGTYLIR